MLKKLEDLRSRAIRHVSALLTGSKNVSYGANVHVGVLTRLWAPDQLCVRDDVYIGKFCTIEVNGEIGGGTMIANSVGIVGRRDHDVRVAGVNVRHSPWIGNDGSPYRLDRVIIGPDVWVGYGAVILGPLTIGRGAVIAAGAVVVRDVEAYEIVGGNPARRLGERFPESGRVEHESRLRGDSSG